MADDLPHVVAEGAVEFLGHKLRLYTLSNGERVFDADDVHQIFGEGGMDVLRSAFPDVDEEPSA